MTLSPITGSPTDEDGLPFPDAWLKRLHPRRGGRPGPAVRLDKKAPAATQALVAAARTSWLDHALRRSANDRQVVDEIELTLRGKATPLGAAALALASVPKHNGKLAPFADAWTLEHGIAFAAVAAVLVGELFVWPTEHVQISTKGSGHNTAAKLALLRRMRVILADCSDDEYAAAVAALDQTRTRGLHCLIASGYLVPTETQWVTEACTEFKGRHKPGDLHQQALLQCALSTEEQCLLLGEIARLSRFGTDFSVCVTMIDGLGNAAAPLFADCLGGFTRAQDIREVASAVARIPGDAALRMLIDRLDQPYLAEAVQEAITRFPKRALGILADAADQPDAKKAATARGLLARHVRTNRDLAISAVPELTPRRAAIVEEHLSQGPMKPLTPAERLPALLASPPWTRGSGPKTPAGPVVLVGLEPPALARVTWTAEELATLDGFHFSADPRWDFDEMAAAVAKGESGGIFDPRGDRLAADLFTSGPVEPNRELLRGWRPEFDSGVDRWLWPILRRFELDAVPALAHAARFGGPAKAAVSLLPVLDLDAARVSADWLARLKTGREAGAAWLDRHGTDAAVLLIPDAVGKPGKARGAAEAALRHLAASLPDLAGVAEAAYGAEAAEAVRAILAVDAVELPPPPKPPALPDWLGPAAFPQVLVRDGESALPESATRELVQLLALAAAGRPDTGLPAALDALDRRSLAEFCWQVFEAWRSVGHPSRQAWALSILGLVGDDDTAGRLAPLIKAWPGESGHHRAVTGLDVLARIGTDHALRLLNEIALRSRFKALKDTAAGKISEIAAQRGLTGEQLADRLVPDLGLDADGGLWLDYGPRRFRVGFDEHLKPFVGDEAGKRRKDLPAPNSKDDAELAAAARARFTALKKEARSVASDAIAHLEAALVEQRAWTAAEFTDLLLAHPLLRHVVRRLVWISELDGVREGFRVAEDLTLADAADDGFTLPPAATVHLAHPLTWSQGLSAWGTVFADYEILQPFPQLDREVHALSDEEAAGRRLARFEGRTVPIGRILGLTAHGWRRSPAMDNGIENCVTRRIDEGRYLVIDLDDGIPVGLVNADFAAEQTLAAVYLSPNAEVYHSGHRDGALRFADLDPITASELLGQLTRLVD